MNTDRSSNSGQARQSSRYYTALGRMACRLRGGKARDDSRDGGARHQPWQVRKYRRGQSTGEMYLMAAIIGVLCIAAAVDLFARMIPSPGWHWLWIVPLSPVVAFAILQITTVVSHFLGTVVASIGMAPEQPASTLTSFFFLTTVTVYAGWAAASGGWIAIFGGVWMVLVTSNLFAAVLEAMRSAERG